MSECVYDVIIVGGGPIGLSSAYQCAVKRGRKIAVIEQFEFGNQHGSSPGFSRQWRTCYSQYNLSALANMTSPLWDQLMYELKDNTLLRRTGVLWFGNGDVHNSEGNIQEAEKNLQLQSLPYTPLRGKDQIAEKFPFIAAAVDGVENPIGLYVSDGGTINIPAVVKGFVNALRKCPTCDLIEESEVTEIEYSQPEIMVTTRNGKRLRSKKVILTPGAYINNALSTLKPAFPSTINYIIYLWCSTYYKLKTSCEEPSSSWPCWYYFGEPKPAAPNGSVDHSSYYGFPRSPFPDLEDKVRVAPAYTSRKEFDFNLYPPNSSERPVDIDAVQYTRSFVERSMPDLNSDPYDITTCIAGFAEMVDESKEDPGAGFVLDFVPGTDNRIVLATGGWCMKFVPVFGVILSDLAIDGVTNFVYSAYIKPMNITRGILNDKESEKPTEEIRLVKRTTEERAAKFFKMWC